MLEIKKHNLFKNLSPKKIIIYFLRIYDEFYKKNLHDSFEYEFLNIPNKKVSLEDVHFYKNAKNFFNFTKVVNDKEFSITYQISEENHGRYDTIYSTLATKYKNDPTKKNEIKFTNSRRSSSYNGLHFGIVDPKGLASIEIKMSDNIIIFDFFSSSIKKKVKISEKISKGIEYIYVSNLNPVITNLSDRYIFYLVKVQKIFLLSIEKDKRGDFYVTQDIELTNFNPNNYEIYNFPIPLLQLKPDGSVDIFQEIIKKGHLYESTFTFVTLKEADKVIKIYRGCTESTQEKPKPINKSRHWLSIDYGIDEENIISTNMFINNNYLPIFTHEEKSVSQNENQDINLLNSEISHWNLNYCVKSNCFLLSFICFNFLFVIKLNQINVKMTYIVENKWKNEKALNFMQKNSNFLPKDMIVDYGSTNLKCLKIEKPLSGFFTGLIAKNIEYESKKYINDFSKNNELIVLYKLKKDEIKNIKHLEVEKVGLNQNIAYTVNIYKSSTNEKSITRFYVTEDRINHSPREIKLPKTLLLEGSFLQCNIPRLFLENNSLNVYKNYSISLVEIWLEEIEKNNFLFIKNILPSGISFQDSFKIWLEIPIKLFFLPTTFKIVLLSKSQSKITKFIKPFLSEKYNYNVFHINFLPLGPFILDKNSFSISKIYQISKIPKELIIRNEKITFFPVKTQILQKMIQFVYFPKSEVPKIIDLPIPSCSIFNNNHRYNVNDLSIIQLNALFFFLPCRTKAFPFESLILKGRYQQIKDIIPTIYNSCDKINSASPISDDNNLYIFSVLDPDLQCKNGNLIIGITEKKLVNSDKKIGILSTVTGQIYNTKIDYHESIKFLFTEWGEIFIYNDINSLKSIYKFSNINSEIESDSKKKLNLNMIGNKESNIQPQIMKTNFIENPHQIAHVRYEIYFRYLLGNLINYKDNPQIAPIFKILNDEIFHFLFYTTNLKKIFNLILSFFVLFAQTALKKYFIKYIKNHISLY